jgi:hypothetical protein
MHPSTATRLALNFLGLLVLNSLLAGVLWRLLSPKRTQFVRNLARTIAVILAVANVGLAGYALSRMWPERWDAYHVSLVLLGMIFAIRFGGALRGSYS